MKKIISLLCMLVLINCSTAKDKDSYKIQFGKQCTKSGQQFSYVWFHTVYGEQQVKKEYCK
jgi:3-deoxy-D-manno-octulosonic-acid transferase